MTGRFARRPAQPQQDRLFQYPLVPCPTVTVICDALHVPAGAARISERSAVEPHKLRTETLAAPASVLLEMGQGWMPQYPMVAFTGARHGFLDDDDRDRLWRRFAMPVFEQLVDDEGRVVASECEAHAGLHIYTPIRHVLSEGEILLDGRPSGIAARESSGLCGCGRIGPRLLEVGPAFRMIAAVQR